MMKRTPNCPRLRWIIFPLTEILLIVISTVASLSAQTDGEGSHEIEFSCVVWEPLPFDIYYVEGAEYRLIDLRVKQRSRTRVITLGSENPVFRVFRKVEDEAGVASYAETGKARVKKSAERMLFMLLPMSGEANTQLRVVGIEDSLSVFPAGAFRFVNTTDRAIIAAFPEIQQEVAPNGIAVLQPEMPDRGGFIPFYVADVNQEKVLYQTRLFAQPNSRQMGFVVIQAASQNRDRVRIRFLSELVSNEPPRANDGRGASPATPEANANE